MITLGSHQALASDARSKLWINSRFQWLGTPSAFFNIAIMSANGTTLGHDQYFFQLYNCPGLRWQDKRKATLIGELRECASRCLTPLPDYQCLSYAPSSLNDKLIAVARLGSATGRIVAFSSAILLPIPSPDDPTNVTTVVHTGLTCIAPEARRSGLTIVLAAHIFRRVVEEHPEGCWATTLAEVPSSLVSMARYASQVFPSPAAPAPSELHLHIARTISERYRDKLCISADAVLDEGSFVFRGSNPLGSCFRKDTDDVKLHHRDKKLNDFYRNLLGNNEGNEVLQVGFVGCETVVESIGREERLRLVGKVQKVRL